MELVDVPDSKSGGCEAVRVRVPPWAYSEGHKQQYFYQKYLGYFKIVFCG